MKLLQLRAALLLLFLLLPALARGQAITAGGPVSPDGKEAVTIDLPSSILKKNCGGSDGSGLCVFTSIEYAAHWCNEVGLLDFQNQMTKEKGGGWPEKVDAMVKKYAKRPDGKPVRYWQYQGRDLAVLRAVLASGRLPAVTYSGRDQVFYRGSIAHMVTLVHLSERWACIRDNNYVGPQQLLWMSPGDFHSRWLNGSNGWAVVLLRPGPPPVPRLEDREPPLPAPVTARFVGDPPKPQRVYKWTPGERSGWKCLHHDGQQIGAYHPAKGWYAKVGNGWEKKAGQPPVDPEPEEVGDYGLGLWHFGDGECFLMDGGEVSRETALGELPQDGALPMVTLVGPAAKQLAGILEAAPWAGRFRVQEYDSPAHWHLKDLGFPAAGVTVQRPSGKVLHYSADATQEAVFGALRKIDPKFDPKKAPDANAPLGGGAFPVVGGLLAVAAGALFIKRRKS